MIIFLLIVIDYNIIHPDGLQPEVTRLDPVPFSISTWIIQLPSSHILGMTHCSVHTSWFSTDRFSSNGCQDLSFWLGLDTFHLCRGSISTDISLGESDTWKIEQSKLKEQNGVIKTNAILCTCLNSYQRNLIMQLWFDLYEWAWRLSKIHVVTSTLHSFLYFIWSWSTKLLRRWPVPGHLDQISFVNNTYIVVRYTVWGHGVTQNWIVFKVLVGCTQTWLKPSSSN